MEKVPCTFCGLPVRVSSKVPDQPVYCCSGCALAAQIPMGENGLPISGQLIAALAIGFGYFNQFLFWSLALALRGEGRDVLAGRFDLVTLVVGIVVLIGTAAVFLAAKVHRWTDWALFAIVAILTLATGWVGLQQGLTSAVVGILATNTLMMITLFRGWVKRFLRK